MKLLIADDSQEIRKILSESAKREGYEVFEATDGNDTLKKFFSNNPDLILLDVMMPKMDGFEVCREIRRQSNIPIIMITAKGEDFERIMGLDIGADDYILKPFSPKEVMARVRAIMRRIERTQDNKEKLRELIVANLRICMDRNTVIMGSPPQKQSADGVGVKGTAIELTKKELEILWTLAERPGRIFTRDYLLDTLWGYDYYGDSRTVDSHIKRLRAKLDKIPHPEWAIQTVWGRGYQLEVKKSEK